MAANVVSKDPDHVPAWLEKRALVINGEHLVLRCTGCSRVGVLSVAALRAHWLHLSVEQRVLVLGQLDLLSMDDKYRHDERVDLAIQWILQEPLRKLESLALTQLAGTPALPQIVDSLTRRQLAVRAEIRSSELQRAILAARGKDTPRDELERLAQHEVDFVRQVARDNPRLRVNNSSSGSHVQRSELDALKVGERAPNGVSVPQAPDERPPASVDAVVVPSPDRLPVPAELTRLCDLAGMKLTTDRLHDNGATHWVVEDPRPIVGGRYVVYIAAPDGEVGLDEVRAVAWSTDDLEAVRGIVVADRFTDRARGFATGVRVQLVDASGVRGQTWTATAYIEEPTDVRAGEPEPLSPASLGYDVADQLVQSQTYLAQRARAGRSAVDDETVITIVRAATNRGGRTTTGLLALRLMTSVANVRSRVASLRRLLNVDGYEIVAYDDESGTVTVDGDLLRAQFALTGPSTEPPTGTVVPPYVQSIRSLPEDLDAS